MAGPGHWAYLTAGMAPLVLLAALTPSGAAGPLVAVVLIAGVSAGFLERSLGQGRRWIALAPPLFGALAVLLSSPASLAGEFLAAGSAVGLLAWRATTAASRLGPRSVVGVGLPGLATLFALAATVALPPPGSLVGAAAGIAVVVLVGLAALLARGPAPGASTL